MFYFSASAGLILRSQVTGRRSQVAGHKSQVAVTGHRSKVEGHRSQAARFAGTTKNISPLYNLSVVINRFFFSFVQHPNV